MSNRSLAAFQKQGKREDTCTTKPSTVGKMQTPRSTVVPHLSQTNPAESSQASDADPFTLESLCPLESHLKKKSKFYHTKLQHV